MDWDEFKNKVQAIFSNNLDEIDLRINDDEIIVVIHDSETENSVDVKCKYRLEEFNILCNNLDSKKADHVGICNHNYYEKLVVSQSNSNSRFRTDGKIISLIDEENKLYYEISRVSNEMLIIYLSNVDIESLQYFWAPINIETVSALEEKITLFTLICRVLRAPISLKITSVKNCDCQDFVDLSNSFLFQIAYNSDLLFKISDDYDEWLPRKSRRSRRSINRLSEIMPPKLLYKTEMTEQYYMALSSSDPFVKFIGYYHIMEYYFDDVYNETLIEVVRDIIRSPGFSLKKDTNIVRIIEEVRKRTKYSREEFLGNELDSLELTLKKYVSIEELKEYFNEQGSALLNYYQTHKINFSDGDSIDFASLTDEKIYKKIAARIYKTRNALVHSKSNDCRLPGKERGVYKPFANSKELEKEIPFMRYLAECIIIKSATEI